jgi:hypothetical protein
MRVLEGGDVVDSQMACEFTVPCITEYLKRAVVRKKGVSQKAVCDAFRCWVFKNTYQRVFVDRPNNNSKATKRIARYLQQNGPTEIMALAQANFPLHSDAIPFGQLSAAEKIMALLLTVSQSVGSYSLDGDKLIWN